MSVLKKHNDLAYVVLLGGEPGLFPELTHKLVTSIQPGNEGCTVA